MNAKSIMQSHWVAFPLLIPAAILLIVHQRLGLSDALNVPTPPGEPEAHLYNWAMVSVCYLGAGVFFLHAFSLWNRGWRWVVAKLVFLAIYWCAILILA